MNCENFQKTNEEPVQTENFSMSQQLKLLTCKRFKILNSLVFKKSILGLSAYFHRKDHFFHLNFFIIRKRKIWQFVRYFCMSGCPFGAVRIALPRLSVLGKWPCACTRTCARLQGLESICKHYRGRHKV